MNQPPENPGRIGNWRRVSDGLTRRVALALYVPVPVRLTFSGLVLSGLSEIDNWALRSPVVAGVKLTETVQFANAAIAMPQVLVWETPGVVQRTTEPHFTEQGSVSPALLFGMRADGEELVGVAFDAEVKAPGAGYASLPDVVGFIVLLGPERRV